MQCNCLSFTFLDSWLNSLSCPNIHIWSSGHRHAVGKQGPVVLELKSSAFDPKEKVWTKFPPEGSKLTPPHNSCDFRWKDYCPQVFRLVFTPWIKIYDHYVTCSCFCVSSWSSAVFWTELQDTAQAVQGGCCWLYVIPMWKWGSPGAFISW